MTQPRPTAAELISAVRDFLAEEVVADLDGRKRFHAKVAVNVLDTIERELRAGPEADGAERARLIELLGDRGGVEVDGDDGGRSRGTAAMPDTSVTTHEMARELARRIRSGDVAVDDDRLLDHLRRTAAADVAIANPRWTT